MVGLPDATWGEMVTAVVVRLRGCAMSPARDMTWLVREGLASFDLESFVSRARTGSEVLQAKAKLDLKSLRAWGKERIATYKVPLPHACWPLRRECWARCATCCAR